MTAADFWPLCILFNGTPDGCGSCKSGPAAVLQEKSAEVRAICFCEGGGSIIERDEIREALVSILYPRRCPVCGRIVRPEEGKMHAACRGKLIPVREPKCLRCGKPLTEREEEYCYDCSSKPFSYRQGFSLWVYNRTASQMMSAFKYKGRQEYAACFGEEFVRRYERELRRIRPQALIPVPVHSSKKRLRGYNQAELLAREISRRTGIPVITDLLIRSRKTEPQKNLNDRERLLNLLQAFSIDKERAKKYSGCRKILLVDDIYTTGSTMEACTKALLAAGMTEVYCASVCIGNGF